MDEANWSTVTELFRHYVGTGKTEEDNLITDNISPEMKLSGDETGNEIRLQKIRRTPWADRWT